MFLMPMNRHMTWGDRQAEAARDKNLEKLRKLAAMAPNPEAPAAAENPTARKVAPKSAQATPTKSSARPATAAAKKAASQKTAANKSSSNKSSASSKKTKSK